MKLERFEIKSHEFRNLIEIQEKVPEVDEDNIPRGQWKKYITTRAKIINDRGSETQGKTGKESSVYKTFYIRTRRNKPINNLNRIIYKDVAYDIEYANDIDEAGIITEIKAKLVK